jgi:hypothetical protein
MEVSPQLDLLVLDSDLAHTLQVLEMFSFIMGLSVRQDYMVLESDRAMAGEPALQVLEMF